MPAEERLVPVLHGQAAPSLLREHARRLDKARDWLLELYHVVMTHGSAQEAGLQINLVGSVRRSRWLLPPAPGNQADHPLLLIDIFIVPNCVYRAFV